MKRLIGGNLYFSHMILARYKSKQYLVFGLKISLLAITFSYLYSKLFTNESLSLEEFTTNLRNVGSFSATSVLIFLILSAANWIFEILKWQTLVSTMEKISFNTALKQTLAALTISLATPNRIGDYGAKAYFYSKEKRRKILLFNFYSNAIQMLCTLVFGSFGLIYFSMLFKNQYLLEIFGVILISSIGFFAIVYFLKDKNLIIKDFTIQNIIDYFKKLPKTAKYRSILFSLLRYLIFSSMFYAMLKFFGAQIDLAKAFPLIFAMYLLVSIVPMLFFFDVVVRGGVAVWLFSYLQVPELIVLCTVLAMWILNFVIPSIIGGFFVLTYKSKEE